MNKLPVNFKDDITPPGIAQKAVEVGAQRFGASRGVDLGARETESVIESRCNLRDHDMSTGREAPDGRVGGGGSDGGDETAAYTR